MLYSYMFYFILYSFFGWLYESVFYTVLFKKPVNTGFLHGCFCPIYGIACTCNVMCFSGIESNFAVFFTTMLAISGIEYIVSSLLEYVFEKRWWDYSEWPLNINGRISLISSLGFGIMSLIQVRILHPLLEQLEGTLPEKAVRIFIIASCVILFIDIFWSLKTMDSDDDKLWFVQEEPEVVHKANEKLASGTRMISEQYSNARAYIAEKFTK